MHIKTWQNLFTQYWIFVVCKKGLHICVEKTSFRFYFFNSWQGLWSIVIERNYHNFAANAERLSLKKKIVLSFFSSSPLFQPGFYGFCMKRNRSVVTSCDITGFASYIALVKICKLFLGMSYNSFLAWRVNFPSQTNFKVFS